MIHLVPITLGGARIADDGAELAELHGETAVAAHQSGGEAADVGAVAVEADALGHHSHVLLRQTGIRTMLAGLRAGIARLDTVEMVFVAHGSGTPFDLRSCERHAARALLAAPKV